MTGLLTAASPREADDELLDRCVRDRAGVAELLARDPHEERLERHEEVLGRHGRLCSALRCCGLQLCGRFAPSLARDPELPPAPPRMPLPVQEQLELQEQD